MCDDCTSKMGSVIASGYLNPYIRIYTPTGEPVRHITREHDQVCCPVGLAVNKKGHIFVGERKGNCVSVFTEEGTFLYSFAHKGKAEGEFNYQGHITPNDLVYSYYYIRFYAYLTSLTCYLCHLSTECLLTLMSHIRTSESCTEASCCEFSLFQRTFDAPAV